MQGIGALQVGAIEVQIMAVGQGVKGCAILSEFSEAGEQRVLYKWVMTCCEDVMKKVK